MLGESMIPWFNLFSGIAVYHVSPEGVLDNDRWISIDEYIKHFEMHALRLNGTAYERGSGRENELIDAIITNAGILCDLGLLERNRSINPPQLSYRVTQKGRKFDVLRGTRFGEFRRKFFFFRHAAFQRLKKYKGIITVAAFLMAVVNAIKFYELALSWISGAWVAISSAVIFLSTVVYTLIAKN